MLGSRSSLPELIDLGPSHYSIDEYEDCLAKLDRVGRWLGGDRATFQAIDHMSQPPQSILDVGCGGGIFTARLARRYPEAKVVGIDVNPQAIRFAKERLAAPNLSFKCQAEPTLKEPNKSYDVVISTLVCHHLSDEQLIDFISRAVKVAKKKVIFNDLHRHPLAYFSFKLIGPLFFKNRLVQHDGPLSVKRAFKYEDWQRYLQQAGLSPKQYRIHWKFAFRWLVEIETGFST